MKQISLSVKNACGMCHNRKHKGLLCAKAIKEHQCLGKNCRYFEKLEHPYWTQVERKSLEEKAFKILNIKCKATPTREIWKVIKELNINDLRRYVEVCNG